MRYPTQRSGRRCAVALAALSAGIYGALGLLLWFVATSL